jgi:predicted small secreted protein
MKKILIVVMLIVLLFVFAGCENAHKTGNRITGGKDMQTFTGCYIVLGGKEIVRGSVTQWRDYDNSDTVQVLVNGKYYLTHYTNVVLVADPDQGALSYSDVSVGWDTINE